MDVRFHSQEDFTVKIGSTDPLPRTQRLIRFVTLLQSLWLSTRKGQETSSHKWEQIDSGFGRNLTIWFQKGWEEA